MAYLCTRKRHKKPRKYHLTKIIIKCQIYRSRLYSEGLFLENRAIYAIARTDRQCLWLSTLAATGLIVLAATDAASPAAAAGLPVVQLAKCGASRVDKTVIRTVVVPAAYEAQARNVWHEPGYETRRVLVEVRAKIALRRVPRHAECERPIGYDTADEFLRPAERSWQTRKILVFRSHYETVYGRILVRSGATKLVHKPILVRSGHGN